MSSAFGQSFGSAWGSAWGTIGGVGGNVFSATILESIVSADQSQNQAQTNNTIIDFVVAGSAQLGGFSINVDRIDASNIFDNSISNRSIRKSLIESTVASHGEFAQYALAAFAANNIVSTEASTTNLRANSAVNEVVFAVDSQTTRDVYSFTLTDNATSVDSASVFNTVKAEHQEQAVSSDEARSLLSSLSRLLESTIAVESQSTNLDSSNAVLEFLNSIDINTSSFRFDVNVVEPVSAIELARNSIRGPSGLNGDINADKQASFGANIDQTGTKRATVSVDSKQARVSKTTGSRIEVVTDLKSQRVDSSSNKITIVDQQGKQLSVSISRKRKVQVS